METKVTEHLPSAGEYYMIPRNRIVSFPDQPRKWFDQSSVAELADSIQQNGQETPIKVCKDNNSSGQFLLISGERRWRAAELIEERTGKPFELKTIVEFVRNAQEHFQKSFLENMHREDMWALDVADSLKRMKQDGSTLETLAKMSGKSVQFITNYIRLTELPDDIKSMMHPSISKDRRLRVTHAIEISRVKDHDIQREVAFETIERNLPIRDTKVLVQGRAQEAGATLDREGDDGLISLRDNSRLFVSFIGRLDKQTASYLEHTNFNQMYLNKINEKEVASNHLTTIDRIIANLEAMKKNIISATK